MNTYKEWLVHSNAAAPYRDALALADQMAQNIRGGVIDHIYRLSKQAYNERLIESDLKYEKGAGTKSRNQKA